MSASQSTTLLLLDSLGRTIANPTSSNRWHLLLELYKMEPDQNVQLQVRSTLLTSVPRRGIEGFFLATFMYEVTGEMAYLEEAGILLLQIRPVDPDRLMAYMVFLWGYFIIRSGGRERFVDILRTARMPEVVDLLGKYFASNTKSALPRRPITAIRKVALVATYIGQQSHAPTPLAFQHAKLLQDLGFQVHVFSAQELRIQEMANYLGNNVNLTTYAPDIAKLREIIPRGVGVTLSDERYSLLRRWEDMLLAVGTFDPDMVLFVGLNSPFLAPLFSSRPILGLCVHSTSPMAELDVWLTGDKTLGGKPCTVWGPAIPPALAYYHPFRVKLKPTAANVSRDDLELGEKTVVLITVGARLHHEIDGEWAKRMVGLLKRHPAVQWLLVGGTATRPPALADLPSAQLKALAHHDDLRAVLRCCDVYVNPPRVGGGFSVAEAMSEGLAVAALKHSDGGDKLGDAAAENVDDYFSKLESWTIDAAVRRTEGEKLRTLFTETLDLDKSAPSLRRACELTLECFKKRTGN
ncbi:MAG TPA: glycosyltransferase [Burkholderiaceae bacterium]